jgi:hypothetical protein
MQTRSLRNAFLSLVAAACGLGLVVNVASCATAGSGGSTASDASTDGPVTEQDATTDTGATVDTGSPVEECNADTMTDPDNCGSCGNKCPANNTCSCGACTPPCTGGLSPCCGQCVDVNKDPNNCGTCGNACVPPMGGTPVCGNGACSFTCATDAGTDGGGPLVECGPDSGTPGCFDLSTSASACGACGVVCQGTDTCSEGKCCPAGNVICGGVCTPINTATNCGACGVPCPAPATCTNGMCVGYVETTAVAPFIDACALSGSATVPSLAGQTSWLMSGAITLPFSFSFYGTAETKAFLGTEATLGFGGPSLFYEGFPDCSNPSPFTAYPAVVAFGDDSFMPGSVCYATIGTAPNRQFVATWDGGTELGDASFLLSVSIVLSETTNAVDLLYSSPAMGSDAGADGGADGGTGDGGGVPVTDPTLAGRMATIGMQLGTSAAATTAISCDKAYLTVTPFDVHLVP